LTVSQDDAAGNDLSADEDDDDDDDDVADDQSFASVDDLGGQYRQYIYVCSAYVVVDQGTAHMFELAQLAEKDPEFYKFLQENDRELLEFNATQGRDDAKDDEDHVMDETDGDDEETEEGDELPILTTDILKTWQRALLEVSCLCFLDHMCTNNMAIAPFSASAPQTAHCISLCSPYE
jgi:nucleolar complex protein 2